MKGWLTCIVLSGWLIVSTTYAEEIKVKKSEVAFPLPSPLVAELASVHLRLFPIHADDIKHAGKPNYQSALVASIIGKGEKKYVFVGFPAKNNANATYEVIMQYCDKNLTYELLSAGLTSGKPDTLYHEFISANGANLILDDICELVYKLYE